MYQSVSLKRGAGLDADSAGSPGAVLIGYASQLDASRPCSGGSIRAGPEHIYTAAASLNRSGEPLRCFSFKLTCTAHTLGDSVSSRMLTTATCGGIWAP